MKRRALALKANPCFLPQSSLGKAVKYFLNEYTAAVGYLRDGQFQIDNNLVYAARGINEIMPRPGLCRAAKNNRLFLRWFPVFRGRSVRHN